MKNADSHIYLYAKGWYKRTDLMQDLRQILGQRSGINPEGLSNYDVGRILMEITWPHIVASGNPQLTFLEFVANLDEENYWKLAMPHGSPYHFVNAVAGACLTILAGAAVLGKNKEVILPLDNPDPEILPLQRRTKNATKT